MVWSWRSTAATRCGWLKPWQADHQDAMPSISSRPSARRIRTPLVETTGSGSGAVFICEYGIQM